ncbi:DUF3054 domain-containing protein [Halopiger goleimassiliensis]|uniref:DUF3054 domain-containing protein n=1 Tax=Halopiger goleimassiliensis TaxID=1293048 RepID=UPI000677C1E2|nr:DUF3054 domain-containing protein [Halopiger goleimassiliensis]
MESSAQWGRGSGVTDRRVLSLVAVDLVAIVVLIVVGQLSHGDDPFGNPIGLLETALPFLVGWLLVAPLAGTYARRVATSAFEAARLTAVAWIAAANVGLLLRSFEQVPGTTEWPFPLVLTTTGLVLLVGVRVAVATLVFTRE